MALECALPSRAEYITWVVFPRSKFPLIIRDRSVRTSVVMSEIRNSQGCGRTVPHRHRPCGLVAYAAPLLQSAVPTKTAIIEHMIKPVVCDG
jgi:hypothetical protein